MANNIYETYKCYGYQFEDSIVAGLDDHFKGRRDIYQASSGTKEDLEQGVDFTLYGVPCDITYNFFGKNFTEKLERSVTIMPGIDVFFGVRTGNSHQNYTSFKTPVLVIGVDADTATLKNWMETIVDAFMQKVDEIIDCGQDQYLDWLDQNAMA